MRTVRTPREQLDVTARTVPIGAAIYDSARFYLCPIEGFDLYS